MNKSILILVFIILSTSSFSQTKEETEKWLLSKLNQYTVENEYEVKHNSHEVNPVLSFYRTNYIDKDYSFEFINLKEIRFLVIRFNRNNFHYTEKNTSTDYRYPHFEELFDKITTEEHFVFLPIYAIDAFNDMGYNKEVVYQNVKVQSNKINIKNLKDGYEKVKNGVLNPTYSTEINIISNYEDNLIVRMNKALLHLKTFYSAPKIINKEIF